MLIEFNDVRPGIVLLAAVVPFLIGFFWYGPFFSKKWMKDTGLTKSDINRANMPKVFGISFLSMAIAALFIGGIISSLHREFTVLDATLTGAVIGFTLAATALAVTYQFAERSLRLLLIDAGYIVISYTVMGFIFGWLL